MALRHSFEKSGNFLFKHRGEIPLLVVAFAIIYLFCGRGFYLLRFVDNTELSITLTILSLFISLLGFMIRAYTVGTTPRGTSGRNTEKQVAEKLNTTGIYSIVRHPLYVGNYLMWAGLLLFTFNIPLFIIVSLFYWLYYERIMYTEEQFLTGVFGEEYNIWSLKTPAFIPRFGNFEKSSTLFSFRAVLRREYTGLLSMGLAYLLIDYLKFYLRPFSKFEFEILPSVYITGGIIILVLILRSLKHYTKVLTPRDERD